MGLEIVGLAMRVEEEFEIELGDEEMSFVSTCGQLCALVEAKLNLLDSPSPREFCPTQRAFYAVRRQLSAISPLEKREIRPSTRLSHVLPPKNRRALWRKLETDLGMSLPPLKRHDFWAFPTGVLGFFTVFFPILFGGLGEWSSAFAVGISGVTLFLGAKLTQPLAIHPASDLADVGTLSRRFAGMTSVQSHREIWPRLREIIADELSVEIEKVRRDADFIHDLGCG